MFLAYLEAGDFVGADIARKYLQMGFTRARRYANYKGEKKYDKEHDCALLEKGTGEEEKARAAAVFLKQWKIAEENPLYQSKKKDWEKAAGLIDFNTLIFTGHQQTFKKGILIIENDQDIRQIVEFI